MSATRRDFIRRVVAASALAATGVVSLFGLLENRPNAPSQQSTITIQPPATTTQESSSGIQQTTTPTTHSSTTSSSATSSASSSTQTSSRTTSQTSTTQVSQSSQSSSSTVPSGYFFVTALSALAGRSSAYFTHPNFGTSLLLNLNGEWKAFNATCTHQPCTVQYTGSSIYCPCHGGVFSPSNGVVQSGPPPTSLPEYGVLVQGNDLYVSSTAIN